MFVMIVCVLIGCGQSYPLGDIYGVDISSFDNSAGLYYRGRYITKFKNIRLKEYSSDYQTMKFDILMKNEEIANCNFENNVLTCEIRVQAQSK